MLGITGNRGKGWRRLGYLLFFVMCGIAGIVHLDGRPYDSGPDRDYLERMAAAMQHRGPDERSVVGWRNVGIAFNRLSIMDLADGHQPFDTPDGRVMAVANGEIYNHEELRRAFDKGSFRSGSDCEVLPRLYQARGRAMFDEVNGMFAMALLDRERRSLWLARDRLGIKPLFYCRTREGRSLLFASELKGLFAHPEAPRDFDWGAALGRQRCLDLRGCQLSSYFHGIERVPAGSVVEIDLDGGGMETFPYWEVDTTAREADDRTEADYVEEFGDLLADSVLKRTMGDVPFGVFLSGGIDSAAVTAIAATSGKAFPTFSTLSRSTLGNGDAESAAAVADHLGLPNRQVFFDCEDSGIGPEDWRRILWQCEMFDVGGEQLYKYYLHQFAKAEYPELKIILLGQGSDEFTGGYFRNLLGEEGPWTPSDWPRLDERLRRDHFTRRAAEAGMYLQYQDLIRAGVFRPEFAECLGAGSLPTTTWDRYRGYYRQNLDYHLWHEDRTSAAHSIENRVPFLDHRLIELLAHVPERLQASLFTDKAILRRAMRGRLPEALVNRPKGEFFFGRDERFTHLMMHSILRADDNALVEQAIRGSELTGGPLEAESFRRHVSEVGADRAFQQGTRLLFLANMGILADLAHQPIEFPSRPLPPSIREVDDGEFSALVEMVQTENHPELTGALVVVLASNFSLLELHRTGDRDGDRGQYYLSKNGWIHRQIESREWGRFLSMADGTRNLDALIAEGGFDREAILREVGECLKRNEIAVVSSDLS